MWFIVYSSDRANRRLIKKMISLLVNENIKLIEEEENYHSNPLITSVIRIKNRLIYPHFIAHLCLLVLPLIILLRQRRRCKRGNHSFYSFRLIRWFQQNKIFSVLVWVCNWILFIHGWFCSILLINLTFYFFFLQMKRSSSIENFWKKIESIEFKTRKVGNLSSANHLHNDFELTSKSYAVWKPPSDGF